jgi:hypothetical protein
MVAAAAAASGARGEVLERPTAVGGGSGKDRRSSVRDSSTGKEGRTRASLRPAESQHSSLRRERSPQTGKGSMGRRGERSELWRRSETMKKQRGPTSRGPSGGGGGVLGRPQGRRARVEGDARRRFREEVWGGAGRARVEAAPESNKSEVN